MLKILINQTRTLIFNQFNCFSNDKGTVRFGIQYDRACSQYRVLRSSVWIKSNMKCVTAQTSCHRQTRFSRFYTKQVGTIQIRINRPWCMYTRYAYLGWLRQQWPLVLVVSESGERESVIKSSQQDNGLIPEKGKWMAKGYGENRRIHTLWD